VDLRAWLDDAEKFLDITGTRTPTTRSSSPYPVAIPTALSWLHIKRSTVIKRREGEAIIEVHPRVLRQLKKISACEG
jgi:hypothetical protein